MTRSIRFAVFSFLVLVVIAAISPEIAQASACNKKVCIDAGPFGGNCEPQYLGGSDANCESMGPYCTWSWCNVT